MSDLRCLRCGYDLRGLEFRGDQERCPECGRLTDLHILAIELVDRQRRCRRFEREIYVAVTIVLGLMLASVAGHEWPSVSIWSRIRTIFTPSGVGFALALLPLAAALTMPILTERSGTSRLAFMAFAVALLLVAPPVFSLPALAGGVLLYHTAAAR
ncbi:MAG: hypothetical protein HKO59_02265 [Phycisphaerales bacterium]|nr:hypothetical protein [Phycisphaerae bacterium]NNF44828.1 hypothetical protein [Phycisphaerales bacterium]NNM24807.1 hypothetical protein [Phycisphaerales bacterium]